MSGRLQLRRAAGWRLPAGAISVARPTRWGNPFPVCEHRTREQAVAQFRDLLLHGRLRGEDLCEHVYTRISRYPDRQEIREFLAGHDLACWCPPHLPCHGDVLLQVAAGAEP